LLNGYDSVESANEQAKATKLATGMSPRGSGHAANSELSLLSEVMRKSDFE